MTKWENTIKDKLEGYESPLPEGSLAAFRAKKDKPVGKKARSWYPWVFAAAIAAGLAALLLLRRPSSYEDSINAITPNPPVAAVSDSTVESAPLQIHAVSPTGPATNPITSAQQSIQHQPPVTKQVASMYAIENKQETIVADMAETAEMQDGSTPSREPSSVPKEINTSPFIPEAHSPKPFRIKAEPAAGVIAGGSLLAALAMPVRRNIRTPEDELLSTFPGATLPDKEKLDIYSHFIPLKAGLSVRIPVWERLGITTGLEYLMYSSRISYYYYGEKRETAHYIGVPVRLDWTLASTRWLDVYFGAGAEADWCLGASSAQYGNVQQIAGDGISFSLLGAGGVQLNLTNNIGLYLEPEIIWTVPSESRVLETYRTWGPWMFSVASGIRITVK